MSTTTGRSSQAPTRQQLDELDALLQRMLDLPVAPGSEAELPAPPPARPARTPRVVASAPGRPEAEPAPSVRPYPASYMVVETSAPPVFVEPPQAVSGLDPATLPMPHVEPPVPGGRHDLSEDVPGDPVQELARRRLDMEGGDWVPFQSSWQPSAQTWGPLAETWRQSAPENEPAPPRSARPPAAPTLADIPAAPSPAPIHTETVVVTEYPPSSAEIPVAAPTPGRRPSRPVILWPAIAFNTVFDLFLLPLGPLGSWLRRPSGGNLLATTGMLCLAGAAAVAFAGVLGWSW